MLAGYVTRRCLVARRTRFEETCRQCSRWAKLLCIGILVPPITVSAMIRQPLSGTNVLAMGTLGGACFLTGALIGRLYIQFADLPSRQAGALLGCCGMSNVVTFGGLITFAFWGNLGLQQLYLYKLFEHVLYYGLFFPWCGTYNPDLGRDRPGVIASFRRHPVTLIPIAAVVIGLVSNYALFEIVRADVPPDWTQDFNVVLVPFHVLLLTFAVGLSLRPSLLRHHLKSCAVVAAIKFALRPLTAVVLAWLCLEAGWINDLAFRVAITISAMPVAFNALIAPALYNLDEDLANSCWIVTTSLMVVVVPVLAILLT